MKICPNCGAENEDSALNCILCELEFDVDETSENDYDSDTSDEILDDQEVIETASAENLSDISDSEPMSDISEVNDSKKHIGLIIAIIILIVAAGVAGGIYYYKTHNANKLKVKGNIEIDENDLSISASVIETNNTTKETETTSVTSTVENEVTTTANSITATSDSFNINDYPTYAEKLNDIINTIEQQLDYIECNNQGITIYYSEGSSVSDFSYAIKDLNGDHFQELLIIRNSDGMLVELYALKNGNAELVLASQERAFCYLCDNHFIEESASGGAALQVYTYYSLDKNNNLVEEVSITNGYDSDGTITYYVNGSLSTQSYADEIMNAYRQGKTPPQISPNSNSGNTNGSSLSNVELGYMYNMFYIETLRGGVSGGYIEDYNGDGIDDLVFWAANAGYMVGYYRYGAIEENNIPDTFNYAYDDPLPGMKTQYYSDETLTEKCREKAVSYGYTANQVFSIGSVHAIGYVKTNELDSTLNLRSAPSTASDVITQLPNGTLFQIDSCYNNNGESISFYDSPVSWYFVSLKYNGVNYSGYISVDYSAAWEVGF